MGKPRIHKKTELQIEFGSRLKEKRRELGFTQEKLAEKADLTSKYIDFLERGEKDILLENAVDFARILKISLDRLIPESET